MTATAPSLTPRNGAPRVDAALRRWQASREGARRFHPAEIGKDVDPERSFGDWLSRVARNDAKGIEKIYGRGLIDFADTHDAAVERGVRVVEKTMSEASGILGGYTVPPELRDDLMSGVSDAALIRPRCFVVPMASYLLNLPIPNSTVGASGLAPFFGGIQLAFQAGSLKESEPSWHTVELRAETLAGYAIASEQVMADGAGLEAWLYRLFSLSIAWYEDYFALTGTGATNQILGIINAPGTLLVSRGSPTTFAAADAQNMMKSIYTLTNDPDESIWLMTRAAAAQLTSLTGWFPNGPLILHGSPVFLTTKQPALGTKGDVLFIDPGLYILGDRGIVDIEYTRYYPSAFGNYQGVWRIIERIAGSPWIDQTITLPDAATTNKISPMVCLV